MTRPRECWQSPVICWQATPAFHNTTVASHDATAASYDTTAAPHESTVTSPNTTAICAGAQDALRGPTTPNLATRRTSSAVTLASTSYSPVQRTRFDIVLPRLPQQLTRRVADCAKVKPISTHFKPGRPTLFPRATSVRVLTAAVLTRAEIGPRQCSSLSFTNTAAIRPMGRTHQQ